MQRIARHKIGGGRSAVAEMGGTIATDDTLQALLPTTAAGAMSNTMTGDTRATGGGVEEAAGFAAVVGCTLMA